MKRSCVVLFVALLAGAAETPKQERGRKLVDEALQVLGGEAFLKVRNRVETGRAYSFYREQLTGLAVAKIYTQYYDKPSGPFHLAQRERQTFGKEQDVVVLFTEDNGYTLTYRGAKPMKADRWNRYVASVRNNFFYILRHRLNEPGLVIEHRESAIWTNMPVELVDITDADNNTVTVYFHRSTRFPVRQVYRVRDPETKYRDEFATIFTKYRDVGGGVQWPLNILTERNGEKQYEIFSESVAINQELPPALFELSKDSKLLKPDR